MLLVLFSVSVHSMYTHENKVPSCLLPKWLCANSCSWAYDVRSPIAGTNEPTTTTLYIRAFQIVLREEGGGYAPAGAGESYILLEGIIFLQGGGNLSRSDFDHSNLFQS